MSLRAIPSTFIKLLLIHFLLSLTKSQDLSPQFPQVVWAYVEEMNELDELEKLCLSNIRHYVGISKYELRILTNENVSRYINASELKKSIDASPFPNKNNLWPGLIQLTILKEYGGVWLDLPLIMTENLQWIKTLVNQKYVNNRIEDPEAILFYRPEWFESTIKRKIGKIQDLVVWPKYLTWFSVIAKDCQFIKDWRKLYIEVSSMSLSQLKAFSQEFDLNPQDFFLNSKDFLSWTAHAIIKTKQIRLDGQYGTGSSRKLAINEYRVSGIDSQETAYMLSTEARSHTHLTTKYFTQIPLRNLDHRFFYLLRMPESVKDEIGTLVDPNIPMAEHLHTSVQLVCKGQRIPFRHIVDGSVIDSFLLEISPKKMVKTYSSEFVTHNCSVTYESAVYQFLMNYLLPLAAFVLHVYVVRRMLLIFKPEWGVRRPRKL